MPVAGFQSAKGDLEEYVPAVGSDAAVLLLLLGRPPGTTPSDVCNGTMAWLDS